jgi:allantoin racemase
MRRLLLINPNTTATITALLRTHAQRTAGPDVAVEAVTARFGAPYIACEASYAVAAHATLDAWSVAMMNARTPPDAVLIGCFGDPGLLALRETSAAPVTGLAEAAFVEAAGASGHGRFAIVTGGARWKPMLERLAQSLGFGGALAGIHTVTQTGAWLAANPAEANTLLAEACRDAAREFDAQTVILGGAGLAGMAEAIQKQVEVPVIDSVQAGVRQALRLLAVHQSPRGTGKFDIAWKNLSDEMRRLGLPPVA